ASPPFVASALPLPFCFFASIAVVFDFGVGDGFCWPPAATAPTLAESGLLLAFCFVASISEPFSLGAGNSFWLPVGIAPALADLALPLSGFLTSSIAIFVFGSDDGIPLPAATVPLPANSTLPLPSVFVASSAAVFGFGTGNGISLPAATMSSSRGRS